MANKKLEFKLILFFVLAYLIILVPVFFKIFYIMPIYYDSSARADVVDGMFYVRDVTGYALADMRVVKITKNSDNTLNINYRYHYMGNIKRSDYGDVDSIISLKYDQETGEKNIVEVLNLSK